MPAPIHLLRHGEVANPDHVIYADLPGYRLSGRGRRQAEAAAQHLATTSVAMVVTSPLDRAIETATIVALSHGCRPVVDEGLTEWKLSSRWAGIVWHDLPNQRPGELEAYLEHPEALPFTPEPLADLAARVASVVNGWRSRVPDGELVFVSHQDPIQAGRRVLCGKALADFNVAKPKHAAVVTLLSQDDGGPAWDEIGYWEPDQGVRFPPITGPSGG